MPMAGSFLLPPSHLVVPLETSGRAGHLMSSQRAMLLLVISFWVFWIFQTPAEIWLLRQMTLGSPRSAWEGVWLLISDHDS